MNREAAIRMKGHWSAFDPEWCHRIQFKEIAKSPLFQAESAFPILLRPIMQEFFEKKWLKTKRFFFYKPIHDELQLFSLD